MTSILTTRLTQNDLDQIWDDFREGIQQMYTTRQMINREFMNLHSQIFKYCAFVVHSTMTTAAGDGSSAERAACETKDREARETDLVCGELPAPGSFGSGGPPPPLDWWWLSATRRKGRESTDVSLITSFVIIFAAALSASITPYCEATAR
ncbi:Cullin-1 [Eumeta japonica]|uniref:Cullin-1 n=1 Tax=Eumeta variegata TaxID=151549 RepID=A0A4C1SEH1_EUMVA|nr:Cullin-1 [Eumeta japonica]